MTDPKGLFKMRFIGKPVGKKMIKGAPGNYNQGEIYNQPWGNGNYPYWERLEEAPVLKAPELSEADNVFEEDVFKPEEEEKPQPKVEIMIEEVPEAETVYAPTVSIEPVEPVVHDDGVNIDPNTRATIEPYMTFSPRTGELSDYDEPIPVEETLSSVEEPEPPVDEPDRDALLKTLEDAGVEVKPRTRTTTLQKMVDSLEP